MVYQTETNSGSAGFVPAPILAKMDRSRPNFPEPCHPLTCPSIPRLTENQLVPISMTVTHHLTVPQLSSGARSVEMKTILPYQRQNDSPVSVDFVDVQIVHKFAG